MHKPKLILLVEDNVVCAKLFLTILESAFGCSVHWVKDGYAALSFLAFARPDLIQMDIQLPDISGWETIRLIQARPELARIPICVVTASGLVNPRLIGPERARASEEMLKPIAMPAYVEMIARQLFSIDSAESGRIGRALLWNSSWPSDRPTLH
jgi:putative two-component system response regulator